MEGLGFEQCEAGAGVMRLVEAGAVSIVVVVRVDDIFAMGHKNRCDKVCDDLNQFVPINNMGELGWYAGRQFSRDWDARMLTISQQILAESTVAKFGVTRGKSIPAVVDLKLEVFENEPDNDEPFRSLVGHLMWLANQTRPDILNAVRAVARYSAAPKLLHWQVALHIVMYIKSTSTYGITSQRGLSNGVQLELYVDVDYAHEANGRRSVSGGVVVCGGACVSFYSRTHKSITLSSTKAEYVAMATGFRETIFMRYLWSFIFPDRDIGCSTVKEDNQGRYIWRKTL